MAWLACLLELRDDHFLCGVVSDFLRAVFRQATCDEFHYLTEAMLPHSGFGISNTGGGSLLLSPNTEVQNSSWLWVNVLTIPQRVIWGLFQRRLYTTFVGGGDFGFYFASRLAWFWLDFQRSD